MGFSVTTAQIRNPLGSETRYVGSSALGLASIPAAAIGAMVTVQTANVNFWDDGSTPNASLGQPVQTSERLYLESRTSLLNFLAAAPVPTSALSVSYYDQP